MISNTYLAGHKKICRILYTLTCMETINIIMDHREINDTLKQTLLSNPAVRIEVKTLKTGDFRINDLLVVERKTFSDLVASIEDGRIFQQASRLSSASVQTLIILEGTANDVKSTAMKREAIQGALVSLALKFRIPVLRSLSPQETAKLMLLTYQQLVEGEYNRKNKFHYRPSAYKKDTKLKRQIFIMQGFPGIGPLKAKMLLDRFGSLNAIFSATISQLKEVDGVGKYTAEQICSVLKEDIQEYQCISLNKMQKHEIIRADTR